MFIGLIVKNRLKYFGLSVLGGILTAIAWPPNCVPFLLFFAFIPFFLLETHFTEKGRGKYFRLYLYLGLFVFNIITTWWVWYASPGGAVFMLFANSLLMLLPFNLYRFGKRILGQNKGLILFVLAWLSLEYFHFRWDLNYPWLTLGNAFATSPSLVQWYEYTGVLGGSLWILTANVAVFGMITQFKRAKSILLAGWILVPVFWSMYLGSTQTMGCSLTDILIIQPNVDPYKKFEAGKREEQLDLFLRLCEEGITPKTDLIILPETALVGNINENYLHRDFAVHSLQKFVKEHNLKGILVGASTHRFYEKGEKLPAYPRYLESENRYYDSYNTALCITADGVENVYHKSKLVPGVESLPFPQFFKHFDALLKLDFGGVSGNLGKDKEAKNFEYEGDYDPQVKIAPLICYESIFGEYVGDFINKEANLIAVITNDGWWRNTPGHKQHMHYARLRAIEHRRYVVRSANTGISCVIDDNGEVIDQLGWWKEGSISARVPLHNYETHYSQSGDYIGKLASFIFVFMVLSIIVKWKVQQSI